MREFSDLHIELLRSASIAFDEAAKFNILAKQELDVDRRNELKRIARLEMSTYNAFTDQVLNESGCELWEMIEAGSKLGEMR
jgi:hypothetical protein